MAVFNWRQLRRFMAPSWLTDGEGGLLGYTVDALKDAFTDRLRLGLLARFPQNGPNGETAPSDALTALGRDRRVIRGINESDASYALRLLKWLDDRQIAGNPFTLMKKLSEYTGPGPAFRTVDVRGNWFSRAADGTQTFLLDGGVGGGSGTPWDWDGTSPVQANWSRFWVIIYPNGLWVPWNWGSGRNWGDTNLTWGSTATPDQVATVKFIVNDWKPAGTKCMNIILAFNNADFDPVGLVGLPDGHWPLWAKESGGVSVPARNTNACYWDGS